MRRVVAFLVLYLGIAAVTSADPIRLTSGTTEANDDFIASFSLFGSGFAAEGAGFGAPIVGRFVVGPVDFSGTFDVFPVNPTNNGTVTIGGKTLSGFPSISLMVAANPILIPDTGRGPQLFKTPFSARGLVLLSDSFPGGNRLLSQDVVGSGTLSFIADNVGDGRFFTRSMGLTFSAVSPSPTPEPGSFLLLGTGLVAAWQSRRVRRAQR